MSRSNAVKNTTVTFFQKTKQLVKEIHTEKPLSQMPLYQIRFFLNQAFQRSSLVIIQISDKQNMNHFYEYYGTVTAAVDEDKRIVLENPDQKTTALINLADIRYIRLAENATV